MILNPGKSAPIPIPGSDVPVLFAPAALERSKARMIEPDRP